MFSIIYAGIQLKGYIMRTYNVFNWEPKAHYQNILKLSHLTSKITFY